MAKSAVPTDPRERQKFLWLFLHAFASQVFIGIYFSVANAQLVHFFESDQLPYAYLASGIVGYAVASQYKRLMQRYSRKWVFGGMLVLVGVVALALCITAEFGELAGEDSMLAKWSSFAIFVFASPFITLVGLESGGLTLSLLDLRQTKRLQGRIAIGGTLASILGCFLMALLVPKVVSNSLHMIYIALLGIVGAVITLVVLVRKFELHDPPAKAEISKKGRESIRKQRYAGLMAATAFVSMIAFYLVDFLYLSAIPQQEFLQDPEQKSQFIAFAFGVIKTGELILSYLSGAILGRFGLRVGMMLLPAFLLIFMTAAVIVGFLELQYSLGMLLFGLVLANKFTERTVRKSIDEPAFRTFFQPLPESKRFAVQGLVEGVYKQWAIVASGLLLLGLGLVLPKQGGAIEPHYIALVSLPVLAALIILVARLHGQYRLKLASYLRKGVGWQLVQESIFGFEMLQYHANSKNQSPYRMMSIRMMEAIQPGSAVRELPKLLSSEDSEAQQLALQVLSNTYESDAEVRHQVEDLAMYSEHTGIRRLAGEAVFRFVQSEAMEAKDSNVQRLSQEQREGILRHCFFAEEAPGSDLMLRLLKDPDRRIRSGAIRLAGRYPDPMYKYSLLELLENPEFASVAAKAISAYGVDIVPDLERLFHRKADHRFKLKIIRIYMHIQHPQVASLLFERLTYPDREIQLEALKALTFLQFKVGPGRLYQVRQRLDERVKYLVWLSAKMHALMGVEGTEELLHSLEQELAVNKEIILLLLGLHYGHSKLALASRSLQDRTGVSNRIFALELIDSLLEDEDKQRVMPIFESTKPLHQIRNYRQKYPQMERSYAEHLCDIINNTQADTGLWIKVNALRLLGELSEEMPLEIAACLYHPHRLVYQVAAEVIAHHYPNTWPRMLDKLEPARARYLHLLMEGGLPDEQLLYDKVELMGEVPLFRGVPQFRLLDLAEAFTVRYFAPGEELLFSRMRDREVVCIVLEGALEAWREDESYFWFSRYQVFIQEVIPAAPSVKLASRRGCKVLIIDREYFFDLTMHQAPLMEALLEGIYATSQKEFELENIQTILRNR